MLHFPAQIKATTSKNYIFFFLLKTSFYTLFGKYDDDLNTEVEKVAEKEETNLKNYNYKNEINSYSATATTATTYALHCKTTTT